MKKILYISAALALCFSASSCWKENLPETGELRHQVKDLVATPGDEEVVLSWSMPEGWNPTDFVITFNDAESAPVTIHTNGEMSYTITELVNEYSYSFGVQAVYGEIYSGKADISAKPTTSRFPVASPIVDTGDQYVELFWAKPSTLVSGYVIKYYMEGDESNVREVTVDKDALGHRFEGLTNDKSYTFTIVVNYQKGPSEGLDLKAMPGVAIPYFVSTTSAAQGWPVTFEFNREEFPDATDVTWTFPDAAVLTGDKVTHGIWATGTKEVVLTAKINGISKQYKIEMNLREWVIATRDHANNGPVNGFKGSYPVFSPDGKTVYVLTFNGISGLYAYDIESGEEKWRFIPESPSNSYNPCTVNPVTGDIYFGTQTAKQFYCVSPEEGELKWQFEGAGSMQSAAPAVSADGSTVFIIDNTGNTFSLNASTGSQNWSVALGLQGGALLVNGNELIVSIKSKEKTIQFLNTADGKVLSTIDCSNEATEIAGIAVSDDKKTAYVPLKGGGLVSIDLATKAVIQKNIFAKNDIYAPVVASNGYVVAGSKDGCVYALKPDLSEVVWTYTHTGTATNNIFNYSHMCADTEGHVMISTGQKAPCQTIILDATTTIAEGKVVSTYCYEDEKDTAERQMGGNNYLDGVLYSLHIGNTKGGAFIGKYIGGTRKFWGGPGGDICGSGCLQSPLLNK